LKFVRGFYWKKAATFTRAGDTVGKGWLRLNGGKRKGKRTLKRKMEGTIGNHFGVSNLKKPCVARVEVDRMNVRGRNPVPSEKSKEGEVK